MFCKRDWVVSPLQGFSCKNKIPPTPGLSPKAKVFHPSGVQSVDKVALSV